MKSNKRIIRVLAGFFKILYTLSIVAFAGTILGFFIDLLWGLNDGSHIKFLIDSFVEVPSSYSFLGGDQFNGVTKVEVRPEYFVSSNIAYRVFSLADSLIRFGLGMILLKQFYKIFESLDGNTGNETPFLQENYYRIRKIGFITLAYAVYGVLISIGFSFFFLKDLKIFGNVVKYYPDFKDLGEVITVLIILAIAEIYKAGIVLKQENELTI